MSVVTRVCVGQLPDFCGVSFVLCEILRIKLRSLFLSHKGILEDLLTKARSNRIQIPHGLIQLVDRVRLGFVARHAWRFNRDFRSLDTNLSQGTLFSQEAPFTREAMDQCISDLIGEPRTGARPCNITNECWRFIGRNNTQGYMTTHQALNLMVGEVKGELHYLERVAFFVYSFIFLINTASRCLMQRLIGVQDVEQ